MISSHIGTLIRREGFMLGAGAALAALVAAVYGQVYRHDFINFDDPLYILGNSYSMDGLTWDGVMWAWSNFDAANWHPLTWLSHMADCAVLGIERPGLHILENAGWHLVNSWLVLWLLRRLTGRDWAALAGAVLFAVHPVNVEAVAWASQRKSLLNFFLMLTALHGYLDYVAKPSFRRYGVSILAFTLSLTAKSMSVTLPVLLLLLDLWPLGRLQWSERPGRGGVWSVLTSRHWWRVCLEKVPFLLIALWLSLITIWAQVSVGAAPSMDHWPIENRLLNVAASYGGYAWNAVLPLKLGVFYPMRDFHQPGAYLLEWSIAGGLAMLTVWAVFRRHAAAVGLLWYWSTLLPVIGLIQVGGQAMADRYFYLPGMGLILAVVAIDWSSLGAVWRNAVFRLLLPGYIGVLAVLAFSQVMVWRHGNLLYEDTMENLGRSWHLSGNLGATYFSYGQFDKALAVFEDALDHYPNDSGLLLNRATVLRVLGREAEAFPILKDLESRHLNRPMVQFSLAVAYDQAGDRYKADAYVRLARMMMSDERTWQLQIERLKRAIDSPGFKLENMVPSARPLASDEPPASTGSMSVSIELAR